MLRINVPHHPKQYYASGDVGDYYGREQGGNFIGEWQGKVAEMIGLSGKARMEDFHALLDNRDPRTGEQLTAKNPENRRPMFDLTYSPSKSVAVMRGLFNDERIAGALLDSVNDNLRRIEAEMMTRVRREGRDEDRWTGSGAWLPFYHTASRPVEGIVDPGDHIHAGLLNLTWDDAERQFKAIQPDAFWSNAPFFEAAWHADLAQRLVGLGYGVERKGNSFEITGVDRSVIEEFSRRTQQVHREADARGITDDKGLGTLGARTREQKIDELSPEDQRQQWRGRVAPNRLESLEALYRESRVREGQEPPDRSKEALRWSLDHLLERESVVTERKLLTEALREGVGAVTLEGLREAMDADAGLIRAEIGGVRMVTTRAIVAEEKSLLDHARRGKGRSEPLNPGGTIRDGRLSGEQRKAVDHIWNSKNPIILFRGVAGTGKTTAAKEAVRGIEAAGRDVVMLAPSADASRGVLAAEGFTGATTVAEFLLNEQLQERARGNAIWVDEAAMMPLRDMTKMVELAKHLNARMILSGDKRQHRSPSRGEPMAMLEDLARLPVAELRTIRRQQGEYRRAVEKLAAGDVERGFTELERLGAIRDTGSDDPKQAVIDAYLEGVRDKKSVLVLSPTNAGGEALTRELRARLKEAGGLDARDHTVERLKPLHMTQAERQDPDRLIGTTAVFVRCSGRFRPGQRVDVTAANAEGIAAHAGAFAAYRRTSLEIAAGDTIRITANGRSLPQGDERRGHRLNNGGLFRVKAIGDGGITLNNGWVLPKDFSFLNHGYVLTSHAGQGKTFDRVLVSAPKESLGAVNTRQLYVDALTRAGILADLHRRPRRPEGGVAPGPPDAARDGTAPAGAAIGLDGADDRAHAPHPPGKDTTATDEGAGRAWKNAANCSMTARGRRCWWPEATRTGPMPASYSGAASGIRSPSCRWRAIGPSTTAKGSRSNIPI